MTNKPSLPQQNLVSDGFALWLSLGDHITQWQGNLHEVPATTDVDQAIQIARERSQTLIKSCQLAMSHLTNQLNAVRANLLVGGDNPLNYKTTWASIPTEIQRHIEMLTVIDLELTRSRTLLGDKTLLNLYQLTAQTLLEAESIILHTLKDVLHL